MEEISNNTLEGSDEEIIIISIISVLAEGPLRVFSRQPRKKVKLSGYIKIFRYVILAVESGNRGNDN